MNILVIDTAGEYGSLIKGVLTSKYFGVSVSMELSEAKEKLNTGLFDMVCIDSDPAKTNSFIGEISKIIPNAPIISLSGKAKENSKAFRTIFKPLSLSGLVKVVGEGVIHLEEIQYKYEHKGLILPAQISSGKETLKCRITELGLKGALLEPLATEAEALKQFAGFFTKKAKKLIASVMKKDEPLIKINSNIAYTEQSPSLKIKRAGLVFDKLKSDDVKILEGLITQAA